MNGHVRCAKCQKHRNEDICPACGEYRCFIIVYWQGKHWRIWNYVPDGQALDYERASRQLTQIRTEIDSKKFNPVDWTTGKIAELKFDVQVDKWLSACKKKLDAREISPETYRLYQSYTKNHFTPFFTGRSVKEIDDKVLEEFKDDILEKKLSIPMKENILAIFHIFLVFLKKKEKIISVITDIPKIKGDKSMLIFVCDYKEQQERLKLLPQPARDVVELMQETGLRPGEVCSLFVSDISLPEQKAKVQRTYSGRVLNELTTKGGHKDFIPLSDRAIEIVKKHMADRIGDAFLFINPVTGEGYKPRNLQDAWRKCFKDIKLKNATRHSFCSQIVEAGASQLQAMALMRHADIRSTLHYFNADTTKLRGIVNRRGKVVEMDSYTEEKLLKKRKGK